MSGPNPYRAPQDPTPPPRDVMKPVLIAVMVVVMLVAAFVVVVRVMDARKSNVPQSHGRPDEPGAPHGMCSSDEYAKRGLSGDWICCHQGASCD